MWARRGHGGSGGSGGGGAGPGGFLGRRPAKGHPALPELEEAEYRALDPGPGPARVAGRTTFRWPRLHWLAFKGLASEAAEIIAEEVDLRSVDATINMTNAEKMLCENVTPLYLAAQEGRLAMVRLLLKHGAQPDLAVYNTGRKRFYTPASVALMFGRVRCYAELRAAFKRQRRAASGRGRRQPLLLRASGCGRLPKETFALELDDDNYL